ncbi:guanylate-binding protein 2-like [Lingula anatina]|uniref:Guanylate-binding protein 2-like n=1 Tax=Lingula anatina TaxID=7574 RepID=A0A1S3I5A9_LINAN|nr:guanylate-binding protein 2-like [Lingula anatina]|eukprot:XP_013393408.1 guanylate-binding protein 2-like [Lingula anatina]
MLLTENIVTLQFGRTPLHHAAVGGHNNVAALLIQHGADPCCGDNGGCTPLHYAAQCGYNNVAALLLHHGADSCSKAWNGHTPLHYAAEGGQRDVVALLLQFGADPSTEDRDGRTPLHYAVKGGHRNLTALLNQARTESCSKDKTHDVMDKPLPLITMCGDGRKFTIDEGAKKGLLNIDKPLSVVVIVSKYHTGKSYLMNRLYGKNSGFDLGSTVQSKTKGSWIRARPHPRDSYINTEGLYDVKNGDSSYDSQFFPLAVLFCFVYNDQGTTEGDTIRKLQYPLIHLKIDRRACNPNEYFESALQFRKGKSRTIFDSNARECIRNRFPQRNCFVLQKPLEDEVLLRLSVCTDAGGLKVQGNPINGRKYASLAETYVQAINSGAVPCIGTAVGTMMQVECQRALEESVKHYRITMENNTVPNMPLFLHELSSLHEQANEEALCVYKGIAVFETEGIFQTKLQESLLSLYTQFVEQNKKVSWDKCRKDLHNAYANIAKKVQAGHYTGARGYGKYQADYQKVKEIYANTQWKGPCGDEEMARLNGAKKSEGKAILEADKVGVELLIV